MQQIRKLAEVDAMRARLENVMKENAEKIDALDLPMPEYSAVYQAIMGVASGTYEEEATPSKQ